MKKAIVLLGLASAMSAFTGCSKDDVTENGWSNETKGRRDNTLVAKMAGDGGGTRTAMGNKSAVWSAEDRIALYADISSSEHFLPFDISDADAGTATAGFTLDANYQDGWDNEDYYPLRAPGINQCVAVYPYAAAFYYSPYKDLVRLGAAIPAAQRYVEGSFDNLSVPMIATSTESYKNGVYIYSPMTFKYLAGLIHLTMSAAEQTEIEKIELTGGAFAGNVVVEFLKQEPMDEAFKTVLQGGDGSLGTIEGPGSLKLDGASQTVTMQGPIALSSAPSNVYFSVLPSDYSGQTLTFEFTQSNGLRTEKSLAGHRLNAGEIAQLPAFVYRIPFLPEVNVTQKENHLHATCTENDAVEKYTAEILYNGTVVQSISLDPEAGINLDMLEFDVQAPGRQTLQLTVKAEFKDKSGVDAVYTLPVDFEYDVKPQVPVFTYLTDKKMIQLSNYQSYWKKMEYAFLKKADATAEDFKSVVFTTAEDGVMSYTLVENPPTEIGDYTLAVRTWHDPSDAANGYTEGYHTFSITSQLPSVALLNEVADFGDLTIENWSEIKNGLDEIKYLEVCWVKGESEDFDNPLKTIYSNTDAAYFEDSGDIYFIHIKNAIGAEGKGTYSALVKIWYDDSDPDGYISASMSFSL